MGDGDTYISCGNYWRLLAGRSSIVADPDSALRIARRAPAYPNWFTEGLVGRMGVYTHHWIEHSATGVQLIVPAASWISAGESEAIRKEPERPVRMPPLAKLFEAGPHPADAAWESEASLFVRWGLLGSEPAGAGQRPAFLAFLDRSCGEAVTEALFRKEFGFGYAECERRLSEFLPSAVGHTVRLPIAGVAAQWALRDATSVEVARILGDWGRLEGRAQGLLIGDYERASPGPGRPAFQARQGARGGGPHLAAYGLYEAQVGDGASARDALEAAARAGVVRPQAYLTLARLRLEDALPWPESGIGDLSGPEFASLLALIRTAQAQDPSLAASYELEARLLEHGPVLASAGELGLLERRLGLFPRDARLAYQVATVFRRMGEGREARVIAGRSLALADTPEGAALLRSFLAQTP